MKLKIFLISILTIFCGEIVVAQLPSDLISAAEAGDSSAQFQIGGCYYFGDGVAKNINFAIMWWTKAAEQDHIKAQFNLGTHYKKTEQYNLAVYWLSKAAIAGHKKAQYDLGNCYCFGFGVSKNINNAIKWWTKAAEQGDPNSQFNLAVAYLKGDGVEQNIELAKFWLQEAALQDNQDAVNLLDRIHKNGD